MMLPLWIGMGLMDAVMLGTSLSDRQWDLVQRNAFLTLLAVTMITVDLAIRRKVRNRPKK